MRGVLAWGSAHIEVPLSGSQVSCAWVGGWVGCEMGGWNAGATLRARKRALSLAPHPPKHSKQAHAKESKKKERRLAWAYSSSLARRMSSEAPLPNASSMPASFFTSDTWQGAQGCGSGWVGVGRHRVRGTAQGSGARRGGVRAARGRGARTRMGVRADPSRSSRPLVKAAAEDCTRPSSARAGGGGRLAGGWVSRQAGRQAGHALGCVRTRRCRCSPAQPPPLHPPTPHSHSTYSVHALAHTTHPPTHPFTPPTR